MDPVVNVIIAFFVGVGISGLVAHIAYLNHRVKMLEEANRKNIPYRAYAEIMNAKAVLNSELFESLCKVDLIKNCGSHLDNAIDFEKKAK